jgi:hypothetical protein
MQRKELSINPWNPISTTSVRLQKFIVKSVNTLRKPSNQA